MYCFIKYRRLGVETPSQSRFVGYFEIIKNDLGGLLPSICKLRLNKIIIKSIQGLFCFYNFLLFE